MNLKPVPMPELRSGWGAKDAMQTPNRKRRRTRASDAARFAVILTALLLPSLSLTVFGGLYLWEKGWLLPWAIAAAILIAIVYGLQRWLLGRALPDERTAPAAAADKSDMHPAWTPLEELAWRDVQQIAAKVDVTKLTEPQALIDLAHTTVNAVANRIHADKDDAVWRFTMPEALSITERVSARMNTFIVENIPFGDRLTVSQVLQIYSWRSVANVAERAYDIWRIIRLANPATAVTNEARERLTRAMMQWGKDHVAKRLAEAYIEEIGRAAIDLYGGRLKIAPHDVSATAVDDNAVQAEVPSVDIVVAGDDDLDRARVADLLRKMEAKRADRVTAFVRGHTATDTYLKYPALSVHEFTVARDPSTAKKIMADAAAAFENADVLIVVTKDLHAMSTNAHAALLAATEHARVVPPVLIPVVIEESTDAQSPTARASTVSEIPRLNSAYAGASSKPVKINLSPATDGAERDLWGGFTTVAAELRRIALLRRIDTMKQGGSWTGSGLQAAKAIGRLTKSLLPRRSA